MRERKYRGGEERGREENKSAREQENKPKQGYTKAREQDCKRTRVQGRQTCREKERHIDIGREEDKERRLREQERKTPSVSFATIMQVSRLTLTLTLNP